MKVLHIWDNYAHGLFDQTHQICLDSGIDSRILCLTSIERGLVSSNKIEAIRRVSFDATTGGGILERAWSRASAAFAAAKFRDRARYLMREWAPDAVHIHYGTTAVRLVGVDDVFRGRCIISFYGFDISQALRSPRTVSSYRNIMRSSPLVHVLCDAARERVLALGGGADRIVEANLPVAIERYQGIPIVGPSSVQNWLMPARFVEKKGHVVALHAFRDFLNVYPEAKLTCWGYGDADWLVTLVRQLSLRENVTVIDNKSETEFDQAYIRILADHDAVLAPSVASSEGDDEGGPALTAVMAQAAGKPIICSNFPGSERMVRDGVEGFVVSQNDAKWLGAAMLCLAKDPARARRMGEAGRARAIADYSAGEFRRAILSWYGSSQT